ncbi:MAG TPA: hypothetical protein VFI47_07415 [Acidimicrobiales bacterium]|nr:hypothetical protein [Acidimicrobiales bacterium]
MTVASKLTSLGLAAKVGLGVTVASASVAGAGAAGVLPDQANQRARDAIEAVTPVEFDEPAADHGDNFGGVVSGDATGESDGEPGVDGSEISQMAPGAAHRPTDPGLAPADAGKPDATGTDQATETPAASHLPDDAGAPDGTQSTTPEAPEGPPSTLPSGGDRPGGGGDTIQPG